MTEYRVMSENMTNEDTVPWSERQAKEIGARIKRLREQTGMSVAAVADIATYELGYKLNRTALNNLESGLRKSISVAEVAVIATAIGAAPLALVIDPKDDDVEFVGNNHTTGWDAWRWFNGEKLIDVVEGQDNELASATGSYVQLRRELEDSIGLLYEIRDRSTDTTPEDVTRQALMVYYNWRTLENNGHEFTLPDDVHREAMRAARQLLQARHEQIARRLGGDQMEDDDNG